MSAKINEQDIKNLLETYSPELVKKAIRSALDKTGTWGKKYLVNDVVSNYNVKSQTVSKAIKVSRTTQTSNEVTLQVKSFGLSTRKDFGAWQDGVGTKAFIQKTKMISWPGAWIVRVKNPSAKRAVGSKIHGLRLGRKRHPTTNKPDRGPSITRLIDRIKHREKRDTDLTNHLYQELENQIMKRTMGAPMAAETE